MINLLDKVFISYGTNNYDSSMVKPIDVNSLWGKSVNKPHGGLWGSPIDSDFGWGDFCNRDAFQLKTLSKHFLFKLKKGSKICIIDKADDLVRNSVYDDYMGLYILDIKSIVNNYDGIYVTNNAVYKTSRGIKLSNGIYVSNLSLWDVESICVWNSAIIEPVNEDAFEKSSYHKYEKPLYTPDDEFYYYGFDKLKDRNALQLDADFERYRNTNVEDSRKLFKGEHPGLLAQKHGNSKDAKLARRFNGTIKSGLKNESRIMGNKNVIRLTESDLYNIINEAINNIIGDDNIKGMNFMEVLSLNPSDLSDADLRYACRFLPTEVSDYSLSPEHQIKFDSFFDEVDRRVNSRSVMGESKDSNSKKKKAEMKRDFDDMDIKRAVDKASSMYFLKKKANKNVYDKYSKKDEFPF